AQGNATRIFHKKELPLDINLWELIRLERLSAISYVLSGGYSGPQLYPIKLYEPVKFLEKILDKFPSLFATRMLVVLEKKFFQD
ncbi:MAG: methyltransferase type 11, partial [Proteobacteria bacterium]|nr:methyltransferase type 11 [Pseudomonadota bacterium]